MSKGYEHPEYLVSTEWLAAHLDDDGVRVFDATTILAPAEKGMYTVVSGRAGYDEGHIPGAGFIDLQDELSDKTTKLRFMMPPADQFGAAVGAKGISNDHRVVLYSQANVMWATRLWWMFRAFGHDNVAVLDGGLEKWKAEGRPLSTEAATYAPATFTATRRPGYFTDKDGVLAAIGDGSSTCVINNLAASQFTGTAKSNYGRPGRIANTVNVPYAGLLDEQGCLKPADVLREHFQASGALDAPEIVTYCGGGISATIGAFALTMLGREDVKVYDGSMSEWANDHTLPMETG